MTVHDSHRNNDFDPLSLQVEALQAHFNTTKPTVERPCPGLKEDPNPCGNEKEVGQGYCLDCRKRYQRDRYRNAKITAGATVRTRVHDPRPGRRVCTSCGAISTTEVGSLVGIAVPPICRRCFDVMSTLLNSWTAQELANVAVYLATHQDALGLGATAAKHENVVRVLYARWYAEEMDLATMVARSKPDFDGSTIIPQPNPQRFRYTQEEYNEVASTLYPNADVFKRRAWTHELIAKNVAADEIIQARRYHHEPDNNEH